MRVSKLLGLVPSVILESQITAQKLTGLVDLYKDDLPSPQLFFAEFERWKMKVQARIITADSCAASLKACDPDNIPNLYILHKIAATPSRDIVRVQAFNQCNGKAKKLHEMYHERE